MALFSVSGKNTNEHGELRHPLVVRTPFLLGTDFTESETSTQPTDIVQSLLCISHDAKCQGFISPFYVEGASRYTNSRELQTEMRVLKESY